MIKAVVFDFGGVLAEEGFREGLKAIAEKNGLNPDDFFLTAEALIYETGYLEGMAGEADFWNSLRDKTGISGSDKDLREEILARFIMRPRMLQYAEQLKSRGMIVAILSDQTNWLDELNQRTPFYHYFGPVFNSFKIKRSKKDPSTFTFACSAMAVRPEETLFVDDNAGHIKRAAAMGLQVIHFLDLDSFEKELSARIK